MAIPSGNGTEVIKVFKWEELDDSPTVAIITGVANHIYTILSMIFTNSRAAESAGLHVIMTDSSDANPNFIIKNQSIPEDGSFVWNDKFSMVGNNKLKTYMGSASDNVDVIVTYIDQDWTTE